MESKPHCKFCFHSSIGTVELMVHDEVLTGLKIIREFESASADCQMVNPSLPQPEVITDTIEWVSDFLAGKSDTRFPCFRIEGVSDFTMRILQIARQIPYGRVMTYGELAKKAGCRSARAVGQALSRNPLWLIVPCHRVVGATGIGGYAGGTELKKALLRCERKFQ